MELSFFYAAKLLSAGIKISMDSKGRALDHIFVERLWRSLKYENIYLNACQSVSEVRQGIGEYFEFYNNRRLHQLRVWLHRLIERVKT